MLNAEIAQGRSVLPLRFEHSHNINIIPVGIQVNQVIDCSLLQRIKVQCQ